MTKSLPITLSLIAVVAFGLGAQAAPSVEAPEQANGMLATPTIQPAAAQDPAVQKAVEWIVRTKSERTAQTIAKPAGLRAHRDLNHVLILGYPDTILM
jgi:hypothetical protein